MAISYTPHFNFPLHEDGGKNWGAIINGVFEDIDLYLAEIQNPLSIDDDLLVYDDQLLFYA